ncbi:hypothetical protein C7448_102277 [Tenacibaculum gallaicum]|uniref:Coenzyme PQQ synthesis protein D (PqqD) n=1 Tax=Tenacibaculum gallaicum TaxID=561505 RepID=A0A3E0I7Q5_9FLAO|nr:hypothetical protein [Tenacibaculum gallaicum]REH54752.1 hypothetical protein C7448_102277 [Tenacibaculum gallaicum]
MMNKIIKQDIENKSIVWFQDNNEYLVVEPLVAETLFLLNQNVDKQEIITQITKQLNIPYKETFNLVQDIEVLLNTSKEANKENKPLPVIKPTSFASIKHYKIKGLILEVKYASDLESSLIHPKFAHLEIERTKNINHKFEVFSNHNAISFSVDDVIIDTWNLREIHYFQGKFSMELVQKIHNKKEDKWTGVFHASAVSDNSNSVLFLGDSGNGKSTSLALLQNNGFICLADDFVPVDNNLNVHSFPAAISIKKNSLDTLLPMYPELKTSAEYHFERLNKTVRYLPTNNHDYSLKLPCKALIFIKYQKGSNLIINKISSITAFEQLVPDSWLSPIPQNAKLFLDWFEKLPCYQLTYSDNEKMIETVKKIFADEL